MGSSELTTPPHPQGEAQIIERIMQYFAEHWIETGGNTTNCMANTGTPTQPPPLPNNDRLSKPTLKSITSLGILLEYLPSDAAFILAYAIIILNVDQHNKNKTMRKMEVC